MSPPGTEFKIRARKTVRDNVENCVSSSRTLRWFPAGNRSVRPHSANGRLERRNTPVANTRVQQSSACQSRDQATLAMIWACWPLP